MWMILTRIIHFFNVRAKVTPNAVHSNHLHNMPAVGKQQAYYVID